MKKALDMKVKITSRQFELLMNNFHLISDRGLNIKMDGKTFKKIVPAIYPVNETSKINEQNLYKVKMWLGSFSTGVLIFGDSGSMATSIVKKLYPRATVYMATKVNSKFG